MQMKRRFVRRSLLLWLGTMAGALPGSRAGAAPPAPAAQAEAGAAAAPDDGRAVPERPVAPGEWSENRRYKFRLERIEACGAGPARALRGDVSWVGAFFTVEAREPELFVSPRDLEMRRGGVILGGTFVETSDLRGCKPVLVPKRLRAGETISGFALFEVPRDFRVPTKDPIVISYRPTRWGGARRAEVPVPECLDACVKPWVDKGAKGAKTGDRTPAPSRQRIQ
jgi:hypothetical protein